jgi:hypothetical protein
VGVELARADVRVSFDEIVVDVKERVRCPEVLHAIFTDAVVTANPCNELDIDHRAGAKAMWAQSSGHIIAQLGGVSVGMGVGVTHEHLVFFTRLHCRFLVISLARVAVPQLPFK